jgi:copper(I)-binding protein
MIARFLSLIFIGTVAFVQTVHAEEYRIKDIVVSAPWARATAGPARTGAAYLTLENHGTAMDRLLSASTTVAKHSSIHTTLMEQGVMRMRPVKAVEIHPGEPVVLRPGGMHVMLMGLSAPLRQGEHFRLTLTFEKSGSVEVPVVVKAAGSMGDGHEAPHAPHGHKHGS